MKIFGIRNLFDVYVLLSILFCFINLFDCVSSVVVVLFVHKILPVNQFKVVPPTQSLSMKLIKTATKSRLVKSLKRKNVNLKPRSLQNLTKHPGKQRHQQRPLIQHLLKNS